MATIWTWNGLRSAKFSIGLLQMFLAGTISIEVRQVGGDRRIRCCGRRKISAKIPTEEFSEDFALDERNCPTNSSLRQKRSAKAGRDR